ncbi:hypothetical protein [Cryptosporangium minutisporangium]|uniref:Uncharacterized protein n=1 Tax=Cryptosporangium minutisporangium TaxID=113569 RepID=A0ABP6T8S6_9ACTN
MGPDAAQPAAAPSDEPAGVREQPSAAPPSRVVTAAGARGLGDFDRVATGTNPIVNFLGFLVFAGLLFGVAWGLSWMGRMWAARIVAILWILVIFGALFVVGYAFLQLLSGFRAVYVFRNGLVWTHNRDVQAATWTEVDRMVTTAVQGKDPHEAVIHLLDGRQTRVEFTAENEGVREQLAETLTRWQRPVDFEIAGFTEKDEERQAYRGAAAVLGVAGLFAALFFSFVTNRGFGLPIGFSLVGGFLTVALVLAGLALRFPPLRIVAGIFAGIAGLCLMVEVNRWTDVHFVVVTGAVIAFEAALVSIWRTLHRQLPAPRWFGRRRSLAKSNGWRYLDTAEIPVPGPKSIAHLIGVPTGATTTTGEGVLVATVNGIECTVYDRARRRPLMGDPVLTVWQVPLPATVPYATLKELSMRDISLDERGDVHIFEPTPPTRAAQILDRVIETIPAQVHPDWWIEGRYLCLAESVAPSATTIARRANYLTYLATQTPWQQLADPAVWQPTEPTRWDDDSVFAPAVVEALRLACEGRFPGSDLHTAETLGALIRADPSAGWDRVWQLTGPPESLKLESGVFRTIDPRRSDSAPRPAYRGDALFSPELARALLVAQAIRERYGLLVITTGVLALGLVGFRGAGATEALLAGGRLSHEQLLAEVQAALLGTPLDDLRTIVPAAPN